MFQWIFSTLLIVITFNRCISDERRGLLVIPGLGSPDRLNTVIHNINMLKTDFFLSPRTLDCIIYIYAPRNVTSFWSMTSELSYLSQYCEMIDHPNGRVTANLYLVQPFFTQSYSFIFILLDDCKLLGNGFFPLRQLLKIMEFNKLTVASPKVIGANKGGGQNFRMIMQQEPVAGTVGYESTFVEIFAWITTPQAYSALWDLLYPFVNPYGWGYDMWYDRYGLSKVKDHKMGIISAISVLHDQDFSSPNGGRTETASMKDKWKAVLRQEIFYRRFRGIDLRQCRTASRMKNATWTGPVLGYLYEPH